MEHGIVGLTDEARPLGALARNLERLAGEVKCVEVDCLWIEMGEVLRCNTGAAAGIQDLYIVSGRCIPGAE
jgi:hypothetical protein